MLPSRKLLPFALALLEGLDYLAAVKLQQGQIWNQGDQFILILHLERLEVEYKSFKNLTTRTGMHHHVSKKEFCRLIKHATLVTPAEVQQARQLINAP